MDKPTNFRIHYEWQEGSIPPPYHYEYTIQIGPGPEGEITLSPDYGFNHPSTWTEKWEISSQQFTELYTLLRHLDIGKRQWQARTGVSAGGSVEWLEGNIDGQNFSVPAQLDGADRQAIAEVYRTVRSFVPEPIWNKLMKQREQYVQTYLAK